MAFPPIVGVPAHRRGGKTARAVLANTNDYVRLVTPDPLWMLAPLGRRAVLVASEHCAPSNALLMARSAIYSCARAVAAI